MRRPVDPDEGLGELLSLWSAETADDLHRILVLHPHVRESADTLEPMSLLRRHHEPEPGSSASTAALLLTDRRWRGGLKHLIEQVAGSGFLTDEELHLLAQAFLEADRFLYWEVPDEWFSEEPSLVVDSGDRDSEPEVVSPAVAAREVMPPLRRWATSYLLARDPQGWSRLMAVAQGLEARHQAAVMTGMFDSIDCLPVAAQAVLIGRGASWPHQQVRRAALERIAARDGASAAYALACADPNAKIRDWAATLMRPPSATPTPSQMLASESEPDTLF